MSTFFPLLSHDSFDFWNGDVGTMKATLLGWFYISVLSVFSSYFKKIVIYLNNWDIISSFPPTTVQFSSVTECEKLCHIKCVSHKDNKKNVIDQSHRFSVKGSKTTLQGSLLYITNCKCMKKFGIRWSKYISCESLRETKNDLITKRQKFRYDTFV